MSNVFCIGELLIDFINKDIGKGLEKGINFEKKAGGAPANVCASVCKLGGKSSFLGQVGNDAFGRFLINVLEDANIDTSMVIEEGNTTLAFVAIDENGERNFEFNRGSDGEYSFDKIDLNKINADDILHFGSATGFLEGELKETYFKLLEYARENNMFISFDPNYRDALITEDKLEKYIIDCKHFIKYSDFIKVSDEEIALITKEEDLKKGVALIHEYGAKVVAVTLGSKGTLISFDKEDDIIPSIKITQVDSTGAGDSFVGAVLKKVSEISDKTSINFDDWKNIIQYANVVGAITCTNYGAIDSMPTHEEIENHIKSILKLKPFYSEKVWGYEEWNLSTHRNGHSTVEGSDETLLNNIGHELPILIKIIQANDKLSVQVHPGDEYTRKYENDNGKTECWYVLEACENATLVCGIKSGHTKESFAEVINNNEVEANLERVSVSTGDMIYIPAGTVHAIEGGLKILEVQQSSDVTYRMYDWGRDREMHIQKSLDVIDYEGKNKGGKIENFTKLVTEYFTVEKIEVDGEYTSTVEKDFESYTVIDGCGTIADGDSNIELNKEETIYIKKGTEYKISGNLKLLKSYV